jgi:trimethylamine--corrinoid protein Co-methyltransferase
MTTVQLCRRLYGIPVHAAIGYVDCKRPGLEAVFQKLYPLVSAPFGTGLNPGGYGLLSAGQDYSPVQHLLDAEMASAVDRFWGGFEVSDETIAAELTAAVMARPGGDFLASDHTLRHFRAEQWYPRWFDRSLWQGQAHEHEAEPALLRRLEAYCKDAIRRYEPPALDPAKTAELRRIYATAERRLQG